MKNLAVVATSITLTALSLFSVNAATLEGGIEEVVMPEPPPVQRSTISTYYDPKVEGRIGVRISTCGSIAYVHPGSPAARSGLLKGDQVTLVDGKKHNISQISGRPGSQVELEIKRKHADERFTVVVERVSRYLISP